MGRRAYFDLVRYHLQDQEWGTREMSVQDPFAKRLHLYRNVR